MLNRYFFDRSKKIEKFFIGCSNARTQTSQLLLSKKSIFGFFEIWPDLESGQIEVWWFAQTFFFEITKIKKLTNRTPGGSEQPVQSFSLVLSKEHRFPDFLVVMVCPDHLWANHHNPSWANHQRGVARVLQEQGPDGTPRQVLRLLHRESRVLRQLDRELLTWSHKTGVGASHCNLLRNFTMNNFPRSRVGKFWSFSPSIVFPIEGLAVIQFSFT